MSWAADRSSATTMPKLSANRRGSAGNATTWPSILERASSIVDSRSGKILSLVGPLHAEIALSV